MSEEQLPEGDMTGNGEGAEQEGTNPDEGQEALEAQEGKFA